MNSQKLLMKSEQPTALFSSVLFAIRRLSDGAILFVDEEGNETWQYITAWKERDLMLEPNQEIVSISTI